MKMLVKVPLIILILVLSSLQAAASHDYKDVADALISKLRLPEKTIAYVKTADVSQLKGYKAVIYEVSQGPVAIPLAVYVSKNKKIAIFGEVFVEGKSLAMLQGLTPTMHKLSFELTEKNRIVYNPQGKKKVFMFFDPECPYCRRAIEVITEYKGEEYRFVLKHFPLDSHPGAREEAIKEQAEWLKKTLPGLTGDEIGNLAAEIVDEDIAEGKKAGVNGTPYYVMDGVFLEASPLDVTRNMN